MPEMTLYQLNNALRERLSEIIRNFKKMAMTINKHHLEREKSWILHNSSSVESVGHSLILNMLRSRLASIEGLRHKIRNSSLSTTIAL